MSSVARCTGEEWRWRIHLLSWRNRPRMPITNSSVDSRECSRGKSEDASNGDENFPHSNISMLLEYYSAPDLHQIETPSRA